MTHTIVEHPDIVRAWCDFDSELRATTGGDGNTMVGHFAVFDTWTKIRSSYEGTFMERIAPGAFTGVFANPARVKVLYDHGADPQIGNKPLGTIAELHEDKRGASYVVNLFDEPYVNQLKSAIRAGQLGASFRFQVAEDEWRTPAAATDWNPDGLDERTILRVDPLWEFGPVTFPAYADADSGLRSRTDEWLDHFINDPKFVARFVERCGLAATEHILEKLPPVAQPTDTAVIDGTESNESSRGDENEEHQRRIEGWQRRSSGFVAHLSRLKEATQ